VTAAFPAAADAVGAGPAGADALRLAHATLPVGIAVADRWGRMVYVNARMARLLDCPPERVDIRTFIDATHPDDRLQARARQAALARGELDSYVVETRFVHRDGTTVSARVHVHASIDAPGPPALVIAYAEDITLQEQAGAALRATEARTDALLRHAREVVMILGPAGEIRYTSPAVEAVLGYDVATVAATHPFELLHPDERDPWLEGWRQVASHPDTRLALTTRVLHADGRYRWCDATVRNLTDDQGVDGFLVHLQDVSERRRSEDHLAARALHDTLTGLANRALLVDRLRHALDRAERSGSVVALLFCDLDRFKHVNDTFGHAVGDIVLREVATRLRAVVRPADTVARLGGDEFVVCCEDVTGDTEAVTLAERILAALNAPIAADGRELSVSASVGIAIAGRGAQQPEDVLRSADAAMYAAKGNGRGRYEVFDEGFRTRLRQRLDTERGVRRALTDGELRLHYQPILPIGGDAGADPTAAVGVEALVRWAHPERGLLRPGEFLAVAEESGTTVRVMEWVVDEACRQVHTWRAAGAPVPPVWINLSLAQVTQPRALTSIVNALAAHGLPATALGFDVSERHLDELVHAPGAGDVLEALAGLGCAIAVDDFGTASTPLRAVHRFGVRVLKLDPALWRDAEPDPLLASAVAFGTMLGLTVAAEGVETPEQLDRLRAAGCHWASGFLLGAPAPGEDRAPRRA
jgi:diguanylate cyclase (GGDEF)-like protein/PAS domain S-box-containing protein